MTETTQENEATEGQSRLTAELEALPCPFCGMAADFDDPDTLHPNGSGWLEYENGEFRTYHRYDAVPKEQWCWVMNCPEPSGGCGCEVTGDSKSEALAKWNNRFPVTDDMDIQTEVAWDNWQAAWEAATAAELGGRCCEHRFIGMDASFIHEPEIGAHPIVTVRFALNDWEGRDAFIKHFRHD